MTRPLTAATIALLLCLATGGCAPVDASPVLSTTTPPDEAYLARLTDALNVARADPRAYADSVRAFRGLMRGDRIERPGEIAVLTREGVAAVDEAIAFLERQPAMPVLARSDALDRAARDLAEDQGQTGDVGHLGADGSRPSGRMRRHGRFAATAEAIAYGPERAEDMVMQLIIDDGVPDRGHRRILFSPDYRLVGVACGPHRRLRRICVLDFARAG